MNPSLIFLMIFALTNTQVYNEDILDDVYDVFSNNIGYVEDVLSESISIPIDDSSKKDDYKELKDSLNEIANDLKSDIKDFLQDQKDDLNDEKEDYKDEYSTKEEYKQAADEIKTLTKYSKKMYKIISSMISKAASYKLDEFKVLSANNEQINQ